MGAEWFRSRGTDPCWMLCAGTYCAAPTPGLNVHAGAAQQSFWAYNINRFCLQFRFRPQNPLAVIEAFRRAFTTKDDATLIIKARGRSQSGEPERRLQAAIAQTANVRLVSGDLPGPDYERLLDSADVFLSLHRSEGFGLPLAAAMLRGKPVIATAWSGNLAFMSDETACLVPAQLIPARDEVSAYRHLDAFWADPDIEVAAAWLRRLRNPELRATIGRAGQQHAVACLAPEAYAAAVLAGVGPPCTMPPIGSVTPRSAY